MQPSAWIPHRNLLAILAAGLLCLESALGQPAPLGVDHDKVRNWNQFAERLVTLHEARLQGRDIDTTERVGGYAMADAPDFYREVRYIDRASGQLLSRVQREVEAPENIHLIEVFIYDDEGRLSRDYLAAFLPVYRNAPVQTLINFHVYNGELHAFRQFDASNNRIHEQCRRASDGMVLLLLSEDDLLGKAGERNTSTELYQRCFAGLTQSAGVYLNPLVEIDTRAVPRVNLLNPSPLSRDEIERAIASAESRLRRDTTDTVAYVERGNARFVLREFEQAEADFTAALNIRPEYAEALFGRGMTRGRMGALDAAIADLSAFLALEPQSSIGYTKRGVRHIWNGDLKRAEADLRRALELDATNAEAHDDLGVVLAQRQDYNQALRHFDAAIHHEPTYQKAYHNAALVLQIMGDSERALQRVNQSLQLNPEDRNALVLKAEALRSLGRAQEARAVVQDAEFLPEANWTERLELN